MYTKSGAEAIRVVLITDPGEVEFYDDILTRRHYLGSGQCNRNTLLHVARRGKEDVAIITWEPRTRHWFGMRDKLIGWTKEQRETRLKYCVENRRFLMLVAEKNLASHVLSQSELRLMGDGERRFGHSFLLAETFVDSSAGYEGTCYKATGWTNVGKTKGGRGVRERSQKSYFVKELKNKAIAKLKDPNLTPNDTVNPHQSVLMLERMNIEGLRRRLEQVSDYRKLDSKLPLSSMLALILCAVLAGCCNTADIYRWISQLSTELLRSLGISRAPSHTTLWRVLCNVNNQQLTTLLCEWLAQEAGKIHVDPQFRVISMDGKALRGAARASGAEMQILTLVESISGVMVGQVPVGEKTNEIPHATELLEQSASLDAKTIVTADSMHTQRKTAELIVKKTLITSSQSKATSQRSKKPSSTKRPKDNGRYQRVLRTLTTDV